MYDTGISSLSYSLVPSNQRASRHERFVQSQEIPFGISTQCQTSTVKRSALGGNHLRFAHINCVKSFGSTTTSTTMSGGRDFAPPNFSPQMEFCFTSWTRGLVQPQRLKSKDSISALIFGGCLAASSLAGPHCQVLKLSGVFSFDLIFLHPCNFRA